MTHTMIELPNPFPDEGGVIRLLEPDDCNRDILIARLLDDTYNKPFVIEEGDSRALYFSRDFTQSGMCLSDPTSLEFAYTRMMMSCLLFVHEPKIILMLGLGGGSLAKYCYRHLPLARIVALEIDPDVLAFRDQFLLPPDDARFTILQGDAADYLRTCQIKNDVVMIDAFDRNGFAAAVSSRGFYLDVRDALSSQGVMVANMVGPKAARAAHLDLIANVFNGNIVVLPIESDGNYLVFAFRDPGFEPRWRWIEGQATALQKRYGLDFPKFATALKRSRKDGYLKMTLIQSENN
jgi:spermidine synthase